VPSRVRPAATGGEGGGGVVGDAGDALVHELDAVLDEHGEAQAVAVRDGGDAGEAEPVDPEGEGGLDGVDDEDGGELADVELRHGPGVSERMDRANVAWRLRARMRVPMVL
jgi:hypothetical protein